MHPMDALAGKIALVTGSCVSCIAPEVILTEDARRRIPEATQAELVAQIR
jgi:hypothetical protein